MGGEGVATGSGAISMAMAAGGGSGMAGAVCGMCRKDKVAAPVVATTIKKDMPQRKVSSCRSFRIC